MRKIWTKITGLFFASVLTLALTGKASAESEETSVPEPAPYVAETPTAPVNETPPAETPKAETPKADNQVTEAPKTEEPPAKTPKADIPVVETCQAVPCSFLILLGIRQINREAVDVLIREFDEMSAWAEVFKIHLVTAMDKTNTTAVAGDSDRDLKYIKY